MIFVEALRAQGLAVNCSHITQSNKILVIPDTMIPSNRAPASVERISMALGYVLRALTAQLSYRSMQAVHHQHRHTTRPFTSQALCLKASQPFLPSLNRRACFSHQMTPSCSTREVSWMCPASALRPRCRAVELYPGVQVRGSNARRLRNGLACLSGALSATLQGFCPRAPLRSSWGGPCRCQIRRFPRAI